MLCYLESVLVCTLQIKPPSSPRFTQILSVGIGGSALGPQFVAEALAPDNPPLKVLNIVLTSEVLFLIERFKLVGYYIESFPSFLLHCSLRLFFFTFDC